MCELLTKRPTAGLLRGHAEETAGGMGGGSYHVINRGNHRRDLFAPAGAPEKLQLAARLKATTSVSNSWLAARLAMGAPGSVTQFVRRCTRAERAGARRYRAALSKVHT